MPSIEPDDELHRINGVWLGPPRVTLPFAVRYVAWGVGFVVFFVVITAERFLGIGFGIWTTIWAVIFTVAITTWICRRISYERPIGAMLVLAGRELYTPREPDRQQGGNLRSARPVAVRRAPCPGSAPGSQQSRSASRTKGSLR